MGAVDTTYTFTATDTITSTKMNNIIDQTTMTSDAIIGTTLEVASGKLKVRAQGITSNEMATGSVTSNAILDGTIVNSDINASAAIAGTKISPNFGSQNIVTTGTISTSTNYLARQQTPDEGGEIQFARALDNATAFTVDCYGSGSSPDLRLFGGSSQLATVTSTGSVGIGTTTPYGKFTVSNDNEDGVSLYSSGNFSVINIGGFKNPTDKTARFVYDRDSGLFEIQTGQRDFQAGRFFITDSGSIGIGTTTPSTILGVNGTVTATAFSGPLTGNVTGNVTGSSGSCTGNSATVTNGVYTNASNVFTGSLSFNNNGANTISNGTGDNATLSTYNLAIKSHWGIGFPSYDNVNRIVFDTRNGGAQFSGTVTAPTFSGNATTASTASTVSNGAITAAKLDGAQGGSAPIYGVRAWVNFNGTSGSTAIRQQGNVSSVTRNALGRYTITFATPMQDTSYAIVGFARDADNSGGNYFVSALSGDTKTTSQVQIEVNSTGGTVDSPEVNLMIIR